MNINKYAPIGPNPPEDNTYKFYTKCKKGGKKGGRERGEKRKPGVLRVIRERRDSYFYNFSVKTGQNQHPKRQLAPGEKTEVSGLKNKRIDFRASTGTQK